MKKIALFCLVVLVGIFATSFMASVPSPAADMTKNVSVATPHTVVPDDHYYTLACRSVNDAQLIARTFKKGFDSARAVSDALVSQERCDYAWDAGYSPASNPDNGCMAISETQCFRIVKGTVTTSKNKAYLGYMLLQQKGYTNSGPEFEQNPQLVFTSEK